MTNEEITFWLNDQWPPSVKILNGNAIKFDQDSSTLRMEFTSIAEFCHSGDVVQGGFVSGMLDAAMAYAAIGTPGLCDMVATLEMKVNFLRPGRNGQFSGTGKIIHAGRSIAYLEGDLFQHDVLVATATSTVKLLRS